MKRENKVPLLLCLPSLERLAEVAEKLDRYQREHHNVGYAFPRELLEDSRPVIAAPDWQELDEMETAREMSRPPKSPRRVV